MRNQPAIEKIKAINKAIHGMREDEFALNPEYRSLCDYAMDYLLTLEQKLKENDNIQRKQG